MSVLTVENIQAVLRPIFPNLEVTLENEGSLEDPEPVYTVGYTGATVRRVEMEVTRHSILGSWTEKVQGWQGFVFVSVPATRDTPPDGDETPLTEPFENLAMAITAIAGALVMSAVGDAFGDLQDFPYGDFE